jgi:predicted phosphodiesterase
MRLLATSDLHLGHRENREALLQVSAHERDWLVIAGDVGHRPDQLVFALETLTPRFAKILWTPGNHDLWSLPGGARTSGPERYEQLVEICREFGAVTPEDPYPVWPGDEATTIVPMFLLFDYSFRPPDIPIEEAVQWARASGVVSSDERLIDPGRWGSFGDWCRARCDATAARLDALAPDTPTVLVNHWPLRYDLARPPRVPRFSVWSGTSRTEDWPRRYRARVAISGHLHFRSTLWRDGVRFDEVSLGYPRDWRRERGVDWYLREILPEHSPDSLRFVPARDPFLGDARDSIIPRR